MATGIRRFADQWKWVAKGYQQLMVGGTSEQKLHMVQASKPFVQFYATSALTSGTVDLMKLDYTQTKASTAYIKGLRSTVTIVDVRAGSSVRALYGKLDFSATGYPHGAARCIGAEMVLPSTTNTAGHYSCFEGQFTGTQAAYPAIGASAIVSFMNFGLSGTAATRFNDKGYLFHIDGYTQAAGEFISATTQTIKVRMELMDRYMFLSQYEDTVSIGLTGAKKAAVTTVPEIAVWRTSALTTGSQDLMKLDWVQTADTTGYQKVIRATLNAAGYSLGSSSKVIYASLTVDVKGATGYAAAFAADVTLDTGQLVHGGVYCVDLQLMDAAGTTFGLGGPVAFMNINLNPTSAAALDDNAYLFNITAAAAAGNMVDTTANGTTDIWIKIRFNETDYFLMGSAVATEA